MARIVKRAGLFEKELPDAPDKKPSMLRSFFGSPTAISNTLKMGQQIAGLVGKIPVTTDRQKEIIQLEEDKKSLMQQAAQERADAAKIQAGSVNMSPEQRALIAAQAQQHGLGQFQGPIQAAPLEFESEDAREAHLRQRAIATPEHAALLKSTSLQELGGSFKSANARMLAEKYLDTMSGPSEEERSAFIAQIVKEARALGKDKKTGLYKDPEMLAAEKMIELTQQRTASKLQAQEQAKMMSATLGRVEDVQISTDAEEARLLDEAIKAKMPIESARLQEEELGRINERTQESIDLIEQQKTKLGRTLSDVMVEAGFAKTEADQRALLQEAVTITEPENIAGLFSSDELKVEAVVKVRKMFPAGTKSLSEKDISLIERRRWQNKKEQEREPDYLKKLKANASYKTFKTQVQNDVYKLDKDIKKARLALLRARRIAVKKLSNKSLNDADRGKAVSALITGWRQNRSHHNKLIEKGKLSIAKVATLEANKPNPENYSAKEFNPTYIKDKATWDKNYMAASAAKAAYGGKRLAKSESEIKRIDSNMRKFLKDKGLGRYDLDATSTNYDEEY